MWRLNFNFFFNSMNKYHQLRSKYPDRLPLMIEKSDIKINKKKYLIPYEMYVSEFIRYIYRNMEGNESIILFINGVLPKPSQQINEYCNNEIIKVSILIQTTFG